MRYKFFPQSQFGTITIDDIEFNLSSRHELLPILMAIQYIYTSCQDSLNEILSLIQDDISQGKNVKLGRFGLTYWEILVLVSLRLGCNMDYDQLADIASNHRKIQQMLGISMWDIKSYSKSAIHENYNLLSVKTIVAIKDIIVGLGHEISDDPLKKVRGDSFVLKKNIHYPTDCNLLYDGCRKIIDISKKISVEFKIPGWRQSTHWKKKVKKTNQNIIKTARSRAAGRDDKLQNQYMTMMEQAEKLIDRALNTTFLLDQKVRTKECFQSEYWKGFVSELQYFIAGTEYVCELARRRIINSEVIPNPDKVFSLFEPDTELINRGKRPNPIEFGHRILIIQDDAGFIIHSSVLGNGLTDEKVITDAMKILQHRYNDKIRAASFDKGFWTPKNFIEMSEFIPLVVLPKKGKRNESEYEREHSIDFKQTRKWHSGIESAINALGSGNGMKVCRDKGVDGYERYVATAVLGRNLQNLGMILVEQERKRRKDDDPIMRLIM